LNFTINDKKARQELGYKFEISVSQRLDLMNK